MQSLGLQSGLSCLFAWEYAKAEFDSPVLKSAFCLKENLACIFHDPRFTSWENRAYGITFSMSFHTSPGWLAAEETPADMCVHWMKGRMI